MLAPIRLDFPASPASPPPLVPACARRPAPLRRLAALLVLATLLGGCDVVGKTIDRARMKLFGIVVTDPEPETAEWVLKEVIEAARDSNEERGWERFQKVLHSEERTPNALRAWYDYGWKRMRKQVGDYLAPDGSFKIVDFKEMVRGTGDLSGIEFFVESHKKEMPTPCAVYIDDNSEGRWRIRRCSF